VCFLVCDVIVIYEYRYANPSPQVISRLETMLHVDISLLAFANTRLDNQINQLEDKGIDVKRDISLLQEVCSFLQNKCSSTSYTREEEDSSNEERRTRTRKSRHLLGQSQDEYSMRRRSGLLSHSESDDSDDRVPSSAGRRLLSDGDSHQIPMKTRRKFKALRNQHMSNTSLVSKYNPSPSSSRHGEQHQYEMGDEEGGRQRSAKQLVSSSSVTVDKITSSLSSSEQSSCWRHAADQRSYAQHLKALAHIPCNAKKYKNPVKFDELPEEIKKVATNCSYPASRKRKPMSSQGRPTGRLPRSPPPQQ
jgi:hypothetical protein